MKMELGLDTGPMILKAIEPIAPDDTNATLTEKLARLGGKQRRLLGHHP